MKPKQKQFFQSIYVFRLDFGFFFILLQMLFKSFAKSSQRYICGYYTTHTLKNKYIKRETIKGYSIRRNDSGINMILRIIIPNLLKTKMPDRQINELQKVH